MLRTLEERDIRFVRLWFTDVLGALKSVAVAPAELEGAFADGIGFDGSAIEGFARVHESDMIARPDPSTFQLLPWRGEYPGVARMFCDILLPDGSPSYADPRWVLKRNLSRASEMGFTFYTHPEIEFFLLRDRPEVGSIPVPVDSGGYYDHIPHSIAHDFRRTSITMLEAMGISVEYSHHEGAPGQQEIDLRYADALTTADNIMSFRLVMKEVAMEQGVWATFMPKPFTEYPGSGMHTHISLFEGDQNAFYEAGAEYQLSKTARSFIAGLLRHAPEITAVCNQWVNSYKRLWGGAERTAGPAARPRPTSAGATTTARPWSGSRCTSPRRATRPGSNSARSTPPATPTWPIRSCSRPASRASRRTTSSPRAPKTTCGPSPAPSAARWASSPSRPTSTRPSGSWSQATWSPRPWASTSSTSSSATSAKNGRNTAARSPATN